jgi:integrase
MKLIASTIKALELPPGVRDKTYWCDDVPGFGLRLREGGSRNWIVQYDVAGKARRVTLGPIGLLDANGARQKAKDLLAQIRLGGDPAADKRARRLQATETFGALLPRYLSVQQRAVRPSSFTQIDHRLGTLAKPLHPLPLTSIDRRAIASLLSAVGESSGPSAATNLHSSLSGYFRWLVGEGLLDINPLLHANRPKAGAPRNRILNADELRALWAALGADDYSDVVRLLVYTGARRAEIGDLLWSEVDLDAATIEIPAERMKNGRPHLIPLSEPALAILTRRPRDGRERVFGDGPRGFQNWSRGRKSLDQAIGGERPTWTLHDLRRLVSTTMHDELGIQPHVVEAVLAHVGHRSGVAGVYNLATYAAEKRRALERWATWVDATVTGKPATAEVVQLHGKRS